MGQLEQLICPGTGENCGYYHYCAAEKELNDEGGAHPDSVIGKMRALLPIEVVEAMDSSYCSTHRIVALCGVSTDPTLTPEMQDFAAQRAEDIARSRLHFQSEVA